MINLQRAYDEVSEYLWETMGLDDFKIEISDDGDHLTAKNSLTIKGFDDDVFVSFIIFKSGSFGVDFVFDKLDMTRDSLKLLQNFNSESVWLSAFIRDDDFLVVRYNVMQISNEDVLENVSGAMRRLVSDEIKELLTPLVELTYSE